jgi:exopolyphosphatase/guanosine-5'-triphosphate,3'-diphosphate pyrophosphatase
MIRFDLNPDRSDVITHALEIYTRATEWAGAHQMIVPKKGLADGMVRDLYAAHYQ